MISEPIKQEERANLLFGLYTAIRTVNKLSHKLRNIHNSYNDKIWLC